MKSWFNWRSLRRPKVADQPPVEAPTEDSIAAPLRLLPKKRPLWARFGRKPSPFQLRPGAIEGWMKMRAPVHRTDRPARREDDRGGIGGGR